MHSDYENAIIHKMIDYAKTQDAIRVILLTSSLCNPEASTDILSDFDIEFFFEDPLPFAENDEWLDHLGMGQRMALWHWPNEWDHEKGDGRTWMRMMYLMDGTKIDLSLHYMDDLRKLSNSGSLTDHYDIGYKVLLDKDGVTKTLKQPTHKAFILCPPSQEQYVSRIETFWMESTYVAKYLWREDIFAAKWMLHGITDRGVRQVLQWSVGLEHDWKWRPGKLGRGIQKALAPDVYKELLDSFAAGDINDIWDSLFKTTALYRKTAIKVGDALGYKYLHDLDERVSAFHQSLRDLDKQSGTREELARTLNEVFKH